MFRHLFWKEWRENLWKLVFCGAVSLGFVALLFRIRLFPDSENCIAISFIQMLAVPVVYALDIFSGEMSNRTIHLLFKFPVARWKVFFSKYLVCILGMSFIFLATGGLMEILSQGREAQAGFFIRISVFYGVPSLIVFTWFCAFGAQSRSEAGSLVAMFGVMIGWGIVLFWSMTCEVDWARRFVPYFTTLIWPSGSPLYVTKPLQTFLSLSASSILACSIACYRFVKVRRYL